MSSVKFQYVSIAVLGAACIGLIIWFLLSDSSPITDKSSGNAFAVITFNDVAVEVRKNETSYWAGFTTNDTLQTGDIIRSMGAGLVYLNVSDIGYIELVAPFEIKLNQNSSRNPSEWLLSSGRMRYFYSFDSIDVPNTIATSEGKFIFSTVSKSEFPYREIIVSNTDTEIQIRVLSGNGSWVELNQSALVAESEVLRKTKSNGELFKSILPNAPDFIKSERDGNIISINSSVTSYQGLIVARILRSNNDTLKHVKTTSGSGSGFSITVPESGTYLLQLNTEVPGSGASNWTSSTLIQID
jgi:hypothetical protein